MEYLKAQHEIKNGHQINKSFKYLQLTKIRKLKGLKKYLNIKTNRVRFKFKFGMSD